MKTKPVQKTRKTQMMFGKPAFLEFIAKQSDDDRDDRYVSSQEMAEDVLWRFEAFLDEQNNPKPEIKLPVHVVPPLSDSGSYRVRDAKGKDFGKYTDRVSAELVVAALNKDYEWPDDDEEDDDESVVEDDESESDKLVRSCGCTRPCKCMPKWVTPQELKKIKAAKTATKVSKAKRSIADDIED